MKKIFSYLMIYAMILSLLQPSSHIAPPLDTFAQPNSNFVLNGGLENGLVNWNLNKVGNPVGEITSENAHSGEKSFKISSTLPEATYLWQLLSFPSSSYRFTFWICRTSIDSSAFVELTKKDPWLSGKTGWAPVCSAFYVNRSSIGVEAWDYLGGSGWQYHKHIKWLEISLAPNQWHKVTFIADGTLKKQYVYLEDNLIAELVADDSWAPEVVLFGDGSVNEWWGTFYFDDVSLEVSLDEGTRKRFCQLKDTYQFYRNCIFDNQWWLKLSQKQADAAADYNLYKESVNNYVDTWLDYFEAMTGFPISVVSHLLLMKDIVESLLTLYNMYLSWYTSGVSYCIWNAYYTYDIRADLDLLIAKTDAVICALNDQNLNDLNSALNDLKQATEKAFSGSAIFDGALYNHIGSPYSEIPLVKSSNVYNSLRKHIICFRETLILSYYDITFLQGKAESLYKKVQNGYLEPYFFSLHCRCQTNCYKLFWIRDGKVERIESRVEVAVR